MTAHSSLRPRLALRGRAHPGQAERSLRKRELRRERFRDAITSDQILLQHELILPKLVPRGQHSREWFGLVDYSVLLRRFVPVGIQKFLGGERILWEEGLVLADTSEADFNE